jgi:hypothetical protein
VRRQNFDGDVAIELHVAREVHYTHAPAAELALKRVFASEGRLEVEKLRGWVRHYLEIYPGGLTAGYGRGRSLWEHGDA